MTWYEEPKQGAKPEPADDWRKRPPPWRPPPGAHRMTAEERERLRAAGKKLATRASLDRQDEAAHRAERLGKQSRYTLCAECRHLSHGLCLARPFTGPIRGLPLPDFHKVGGWYYLRPVAEGCNEGSAKEPTQVEAAGMALPEAESKHG